MSRVWAIARLTFWEGIRMRIVLTCLVVLALILVQLPAVRGDNTLAGRIQNFLAYSLGCMGALLAMATIFMSSATLSNEIKTNVIHLVVTKPVSRFQILFGKWLGINLLNILLVGICGVSIYAAARYMRNLPVEFERDRVKVRDVVWTARMSKEPEVPEEQFRAQADEEVRAMIEEGTIDEKNLEVVGEALKEKYAEIRNRWWRLTNGESRIFRFEGLAPPESAEQTVEVRFKARGLPIPLDEMLQVGWAFLDPDTGAALGRPMVTHERNAQRHSFLVRGERVIREGRAQLEVINPPTPTDDTKVFFEGASSLEILYRVSSFEANYVKALVMTLFQLGFLSAVALFFSTFVSFPVACLCAITAYLMSIAWPFWYESIGATMEIWTADLDPFGRFGPYVRYLLVPILHLFPDFAKYNGAGRLIEGEYISYSLLIESGAWVIAAGGVLLLVVGWFIFREREIASVQV